MYDPISGLKSTKNNWLVVQKWVYGWTQYWYCFDLASKNVFLNRTKATWKFLKGIVSLLLYFIQCYKIPRKIDLFLRRFKRKKYNAGDSPKATSQKKAFHYDTQRVRLQIACNCQRLFPTYLKVMKMSRLLIALHFECIHRTVSNKR